MNLMATSRWHSTCIVWERVKCELMVKVLDGIGLLMQLVTANGAIILELIVQLSVKLVAADQPSDGINTKACILFYL